MVTIGQLVREGAESLESVGVSTPRLDAEVLLYHILGVDRLHLAMYPEKEVSAEAQKMFKNNVEKRKAFMPIQYIVKKQEFMGLDFHVEEGVLIHRGDT